MVDGVGGEGKYGVVGENGKGEKKGARKVGKQDEFGKKKDSR